MSEVMELDQNNTVLTVTLVGLNSLPRAINSGIILCRSGLLDVDVVVHGVAAIVVVAVLDLEVGQDWL